MKTKNKEKIDDNELKTKKHLSIYYVMPWNLRKEINVLGYEFNTTRMLIVYSVVIMIMCIFGYLFKFGIFYYIPIIVAGLLFSPSIIHNIYKNKYEFKRFSDVKVYVEQMLYAFKNSQKVLTSLEDVRILFPEGPMREVIDEACSMISSPTSAKADEDIERKALDIIEKRYPNKYIKELHNFMLKVERIGGNFDASIDLLLNNLIMWENRVYKLQNKRKSKKGEILGSCVLSLLLCAATLYILPSTVDISISPIVRLVNVIAIIVSVKIYVSADKKLSSDLISPKKRMKDSVLMSSYNRFVNYNPKKEFKKSLIWSIIPICIMISAKLIFHNNIVFIVGFCLLPFMLSQHMIGHNLLANKLKTEIGAAFPQWLMELALLLQSDNVQVSIFKTISTAEPIMKIELIHLREELILHPASSEPFLNFFYKFQMPEITTSMQMLYALSTGAGGDSNTQIANIVKRNNILLDRAEEKANDNSMAGMYTLFLAPVLVGTAVLMVDMTVFLMQFMSTMNLNM